MNRSIKAGLVALVLMLVTFKACSLSSGPIDGQVLDETTGKPVAGAIVVVTWTGDWTKIFGESSSSCYHVETARTDANGKYHIPGWSREWRSSNLRVSTRPPLFEAYKTGYTRPTTSSDKAGIVLVRPFKGTKDEYFDYLGRVATGNGCSGPGESAKNLYRLYVPLAKAMSDFAETQDQKRRAEYFTFSVDSLLVDQTKPTFSNKHGAKENVDPADKYNAEDLLK